MINAHPMIMITIIILINLVAYDRLYRYTKTKTSKDILSFFFAMILGLYLTYMMYKNPYPDRYNVIWSIMSYIVWFLFTVITSDNKVNKEEFIGFILTLVGMIFTYKNIKI